MKIDSSLMFEPAKVGPMAAQLEESGRSEEHTSELQSLTNLG